MRPRMIVLGIFLQHTRNVGEFRLEKFPFQVRHGSGRGRGVLLTHAIVGFQERSSMIPYLIILGIAASQLRG